MGTNDRVVTAAWLMRMKKDLIERECQGLLEFLESPFTLEQVAGHDAVKAWLREDAELLRRGKDVSLLVVGHGEWRGDGLEALAGSLGLGERAAFIGPVPHEQIADYYDLMDVFVVSRPAFSSIGSEASKYSPGFIGSDGGS